MALGDAELLEMAEEELAAACGLPFAEIARITPWGDSFTGYAPSGREVEIERRYLWADAPGGAVAVEVEVRDMIARTGVETRRTLER